MRARIQKISKYAPSIFQGRLELQRAGRAMSLTVEHPAERLLLRVLMLALLVFAVLYIYFVGASILNVIARKDALQQMATLAGAVASLEREYFTSTSSVGPDAGQRLGLQPVSATAYVHSTEGRVADTIVSDAI
jgi:hypothetical protein